jgi:cell division protein FtsL
VSVRYLILCCLVFTTLTSAITAVYVKHESRKRFIELQSLMRERDELAMEWSRLQLEYSAWATHDRIESVAKKKLDLYAPPTASVVLVTH